MDIYKKVGHTVVVFVGYSYSYICLNSIHSVKIVLSLLGMSTCTMSVTKLLPFFGIPWITFYPGGNSESCSVTVPSWWKVALRRPLAIFVLML